MRGGRDVRAVPAQALAAEPRAGVLGRVQRGRPHLLVGHDDEPTALAGDPARNTVPLAEAVVSQGEGWYRRAIGDKQRELGARWHLRQADSCTARLSRIIPASPQGRFRCHSDRHT